MSKIKLVVFDVAGTTLEDRSIVLDAFTDAFNKYKIFPTKSIVNDVMGLSKPTAIKIVLEKLKEDTKLVSDIHNKFLENTLSYYKTHPDVKEIDGTSDVFYELKKLDIKVALDTGFSRNILNVILERTQWEKNSLLDYTITSDEVIAGRPEPHMINSIMSNFFIKDPIDVMKVGDTVSDLCEGQNSGCKYVVGVLSGTCNREELSKHYHTHIINSITDLPAIIKSL